MVLLTRIHKSLSRPDVRQNPLKAVSKRVWWKIRWRLRAEPWILVLKNGMRTATPRGGSGALIYYQGVSEPETADFFLRFVRPDMIIFDVGAHLGEYMLLAAGSMISTGRIYAFEPHPGMFRILQQNAHMNKLTNVSLHSVCVSNQDGSAEFEMFSEPTLSSLRPNQVTGDKQPISTSVVPSVQLDTFCRQKGIETVDLIKVDVEGAELLVFQGADILLSQSPQQAPTLLFECKDANYSRFEYTSQEVLAWLQSKGYSIFEYQTGGHITPVDADAIQRHRSSNLLATKEPEALRARLKHFEDLVL